MVDLPAPMEAGAPLEAGPMMAVEVEALPHCSPMTAVEAVESAAHRPRNCARRPEQAPLQPSRLPQGTDSQCARSCLSRGTTRPLPYVDTQIRLCEHGPLS